jgi:hypothetical protein
MMQSITRVYLTEIIFRTISRSIDTYRQSKKGFSYQYDPPVPASEEETAEFIHTIPYFDDGLKDFLFGNVPEENIIISQSWETAFIRQCILWADSFEWLHGDHSYLRDTHLNSIKKNVPFLTLPY